MKKLRIVLADDHTLMRSGLRALLEHHDRFEIVGEAENGRETVSMCGSLLPDIVILDVGMPLLNGIEATKALLKESPSTGVVMLSMHSDEAYVMRSLRAGARAYLLKDSAASELLSAIDAVSQGKSFFSSAIRRLLAEDYVRALQQLGASDSYELLTLREKEILQLLAEGKTNKEVASVLNISPYTVETHRGNGARHKRPKGHPLSGYTSRRQVRRLALLARRRGRSLLAPDCDFSDRRLARVFSGRRPWRLRLSSLSANPR